MAVPNFNSTSELMVQQTTTTTKLSQAIYSVSGRAQSIHLVSLSTPEHIQLT